MKFLWPHMLWLGLLLPAAVMLYVWSLQRRRAALRFANLALVKEALAAGPGRRRHIPPVLILLAFAALIMAAARPHAVVTLPADKRTIVLAMDVSASMRADDVAPNRLTASQMAAKSFAEQLPVDIRIGVVAYAGTAQVVQQPTLNRQDVLDSIDRFQLQRATAIGSGLLISLATLLPEAKIDLSETYGERNPLKKGADSDLKPDEVQSVAPGSYESGAVVLLSDGANTRGVDPIEAAQVAAKHGVKVFTVGFGTSDGVIIGFDGWSMRVKLDEATLKKIADMTGGEYFHAVTGPDLEKIYGALKSRFALRKQEMELTTFFADAAALLMLTAVALSVWWFGRVA